MQAWFYELQGSGGHLLAEHDYLGSVEAMHLNEHWAAAIFEGEPALRTFSHHMLSQAPRLSSLHVNYTIASCGHLAYSRSSGF